MRLINDLGYSKKRVEQEFQDTFVDTDGILRWMTNLQIPFDDLLADFRTLGLITEEVQLCIFADAKLNWSSMNGQFLGEAGSAL